MAAHASVLAWRVLWTEEPGGLQSMGLDTARHDWSELTCIRGTRQVFLCILNAISLFVILPNTAPFISCPYIINFPFNWNTFTANVVFSKFRLMSWARIQAPEANCLGLNLGYATYYPCNLWQIKRRCDGMGWEGGLRGRGDICVCVYIHIHIYI